METIFNRALESVANGAGFRVDFQNRTLKVGGKYLIKDGIYKGELGIDPPLNPLSTIERLYSQYRRSIPSESSENKCKKYFRALDEKELSDDDMFYGEYRNVAQLRLELYILCAIIQNKFDWSQFAEGKWFWKSEKHPSLIILKNWITNN